VRERKDRGGVTEFQCRSVGGIQGKAFRMVIGPEVKKRSMTIPKTTRRKNTEEISREGLLRSSFRNAFAKTRKPASKSGKERKNSEGERGYRSVRLVLRKGKGTGFISAKLNTSEVELLGLNTSRNFPKTKSHSSYLRLELKENWQGSNPDDAKARIRPGEMGNRHGEEG